MDNQPPSQRLPPSSTSTTSTHSSSLSSSFPSFHLPRPLRHFSGSSLASSQGSYRNSSPLPRLPISSLHHSQKGWRFTPRPQFESTQSISLNKTLQDGNLVDHTSINPAPRLPHLPRFEGRFHARPHSPFTSTPTAISVATPSLPVQDTSLRFKSFSAHLHKNDQAPPSLGAPTGHSYSRLPRRFLGGSFVRRTSPSPYANGQAKDDAVRMDYQPEEITPPADTVIGTPRDDHQHRHHGSDHSWQEDPIHPPSSLPTPIPIFCLRSTTRRLHRFRDGDATWQSASTLSDTTLIGTTQQDSLTPIPLLDSAMRHHLYHAPGSLMVDLTAPTLERETNDSTSTNDTGIYGRINDGLGNCIGPTYDSGTLDTNRTASSHQLQGAVSDLEISHPSSTGSSPTRAAVHRQHDSDLLSQQVWRHTLTRPQQTGDADMDLLFHQPRPSLDPVRPLALQSGRCAIPADDPTERLGSLSIDIPHAGPDMGSPPYRPLRLPYEHQSASPIRDLELSPVRGLDQRLLQGLDDHPRSIVPVPPVELTPAHFTSPPATAETSHTDHTQLALGPMVANPPANGTITTTPPPTLSHINQSTRRRRSPSPPMEFSRMEHLNKRFRSAHLSQSAITTINATQHSRNRNYQTHQRLFFMWCRHRNLDPLAPHAPHVVSFLADTREAKNWAVSTTMNAKSAILDLYSTIEQQNIRSDSSYVMYIKALKDSRIPTRRDFEYDLMPVFAYIRALGPNDSMSPLNLSRKTAWLLAMCGFLRPSDLHRTDLDLTEVNRAGQLVLHVVAPKDKRKGSRRIKSVTIHPHSDPVFCPVQVFLVYRRRLASDPLRAPHPVVPTATINYLFRNPQQVGAQVTSTTISKYMSHVMSHIGRAPDAPVPDPRHLGSTLAATAGLSVDDIVAHGGWASQDTFLLFYRQSSETHTDFTNSTLDQQPRSQSGLCNVM